MATPIETKSPKFTAEVFATNAGCFTFQFHRDSSIPFERGYGEEANAARTSFMASEAALGYITAIGIMAAEDEKLRQAKEELAAAQRRVNVVEASGMGKALEQLDKCQAAVDRAERSHELIKQRFNAAREAAIVELKKHEQQFQSEVNRLATIHQKEAIQELVAASEEILEKYFRAKAALINTPPMPGIDTMIPAGKSKPAPVVAVPTAPGPHYIREAELV